MSPLLFLSAPLLAFAPALGSELPVLPISDNAKRQDERRARVRSKQSPGPTVQLSSEDAAGSGSLGEIAPHHAVELNSTDALLPSPDTQVTTAHVQKHKIMRTGTDVDKKDRKGHFELEILALGSFVSENANEHLEDLAAAPEPTADTAQLVRDGDAELETSAVLDVASEDFQVPSVTAAAVPNEAAAFEVTGAGVAHFNGAYMPSTMPNTAAGACTSLTWQLSNANGLHSLYNLNGAWLLDLFGSTPLYSGADGGACTPDSAAWAALDAAGGSAPTVARKTAAAYTTLAPVTTVTTTAAAVMAATYFVVSNAGIPGFNGVYYTTPDVVVDQRCERTFAKDGPDNTEYTLAFGNPMWYFQSSIAGAQQRPYMGADDGSCSPENTNWLTTSPSGGSAPTVVRSATATTTTTTTTITSTTALAKFMQR